MVPWLYIYTGHENKQHDLIGITLYMNNKKWNKHHWPQKKMFKVEKLKSLTHDTALTFISETVTSCLGHCLKA